MKKWNLIIDIDRCNNCNNCTLSTRDEHIGNDFPGYAAAQPKHGHHWIEMKRAEHGSAPIVDIVNVPTMCNHCDDAPCIKVGRGAVAKRADGIVIIDPVKARGRKDLVSACPYGAVWWNEALNLPQAWIFDAHLLDQGWKEPRCAQACPTAAINALLTDDASMQAQVQAQQLEVMQPELQTRPRVYYRNLHRYQQWTLAGTVAACADGVEDCLEGVAVTLYLEGQQVAQGVTDCYGEFRLNRLSPQRQTYTLTLACNGYAPLQTVAELHASTTLPVTFMHPLSGVAR